MSQATFITTPTICGLYRDESCIEVDYAVKSSVSSTYLHAESSVIGEKLSKPSTKITHPHPSTSKLRHQRLNRSPLSKWNSTAVQLVMQQTRLKRKKKLWRPGVRARPCVEQGNFLALNKQTVVVYH